jgi:hypothetical protein
MRMIPTTILSCVSLVIAATAHAAEDFERCTDLVKECFAYSGQERGDLPREPHDQPLDGILTEAGYIAVRKDL